MKSQNAKKILEMTADSSEMPHAEVVTSIDPSATSFDRGLEALEVDIYILMSGVCLVSLLLLAPLEVRGV
jgi:hypothetical protein